jgi:hypothetical protein
MSTDAITEKLGTIEGSVRTFIDKNNSKVKELDSRIFQVEQHLVSKTGAGPFIGADKSMGQLVVESDGFAAFRKGARSSGQIEIGSFKASTITSGTWTAGPDFLPRIAAPPMPTLPLRALVPSFGVTTNLVEYCKEVSATGGSGYQYPEGSDKGQSDLGFKDDQTGSSSSRTAVFSLSRVSDRLEEQRQ